MVVAVQTFKSDSSQGAVSRVASYLSEGTAFVDALFVLDSTLQIV